MILADRNHLEAHLRKLTLDVRHKEMKFFTSNFRVMATQATFMCGTAFGILYSKPTYNKGVENGWRDSGSFREILYVALACLGIGFTMLVMVTSAYALIFGIDLAYRGADGSMSRAIDGMYEQRRLALRFFYCGVASTFSSMGALAFCKLRWKVSAYPVGAMLVSGVATILFVRYRIRERFKFPTDYSRRPDEFLLANYDAERLQAAREPDEESGGNIQLKLV